jgi:soluble lytic murein transglycosylase
MKRLTLALALAACSSTHDADASGEVVSPTPTSGLARAVQQSGALKAAQDAIDAGHPWRATQLVAPLLRDPQRKTPAATLVAARAAAGWGGWSVVDKLLVDEPWIDTQSDGEARELLTRAAFDRSADTTALRYANAAVQQSKSKADRDARIVLLARALERNNEFDTAATLYRQSAKSYPTIRDWLLLRAAGSESDSARRAADFSGVAMTVAKARVAWTDAQARERFADALGAASRYASLGATVTALRLRLSVAPDSALRSVIQRELLGFIRTHPGTADARQAVEVLDKGFTSLAPADELTIARTIASSGPSPRAATAFQRAFANPSAITPSDRLLYANVLSRSGRTRDAIAQLDAVQGALAGQAAYQKARVILTSGTADATKAALRSVITTFAKDTSAAASALYLLADLTTDSGDDKAAQTSYRRLYRSYPTSSFAPSARFRAAMIEYVAGKSTTAAHMFDSLITASPRSSEVTAAQYWSGRAWSKSGNESRARARWSEILTQQPTSYYAGAAARRLDQKPWTPPAKADSFPNIPAVDSAFARAALLERLGMDAEARLEYDAVDAAASASVDRQLATAHAFLANGQASRAIRIAQKLPDAGLRDARTYRLLFPIVDRDELSRAASARSLDPALVAGLIRQESNFTPRAVSVAGARGLMQLLPSVGQEIARNLSFPVWHSALLFDADANLELGTAHLATYMKQYGPLPRVLAAYNAGGSRVTRWSTKGGVDDPEVFIERIPFVETRDYVRIVQRNAQLYRLIYEW